MCWDPDVGIEEDDCYTSYDYASGWVSNVDMLDVRRQGCRADDMHWAWMPGMFGRELLDVSVDQETDVGCKHGNQFVSYIEGVVAETPECHTHEGFSSYNGMHYTHTNKDKDTWQPAKERLMHAWKGTPNTKACPIWERGLERKVARKYIKHAYVVLLLLRKVDKLVTLLCSTIGTPNTSLIHTLVNNTLSHRAHPHLTRMATRSVLMCNT